MFFAGLMALIPVLDLTMKSGIESQRDEAYPKTVLGTGGKVQLRKLHNPGFPLGVLKEKKNIVMHLPLAVTSALLLRFSSLLPKKGRSGEKLGLALCIGGSLSNLFDRFFRGYVVDYLYVDTAPLNKVVFNLGDMGIASGAVVTALSALIAPKGPGKDGTSGR